MAGQRSFSRGQLHYLLTNPTYLGRIRHHDKTYPGQHPAIIDQALWDSVQAKLLSSRARPRGPMATPPQARWLTTKLRDDTGDILTPTHTERRGRKYFYYISHRLIRQGKDAQAWRLPAQELEDTIAGILQSALNRAAERHQVVALPDASDMGRIGHAVTALCQRLAAEPSLTGGLVTSAILHRARIALKLDPTALAAALNAVATGGLQLHPTDFSPDLLAHDHAIVLKRRGVETRIIAGETQRAPDPALVRILASAHTWAKALKSGTPLKTLVAETGHSEPYLRARIPLAFLSPALQSAILEGSQRPDLSVASLIADDMPLDWAEQERRFG